MERIVELIQHPERLDRDTLYELRSMLALYPYYQNVRLLMLQNLYLLHDPTFDEELQRKIQSRSRRLTSRAHCRSSTTSSTPSLRKMRSRQNPSASRRLPMLPSIMSPICWRQKAMWLQKTKSYRKCPDRI